MKELSYLLITDGSSDRALIHIITWVLRQQLVDCAIESNWVDPYLLPDRSRNPSDRLTWIIEKSLYLYDKTDVLFIHRDAERQTREQRIREIESALADLIPTPPPICVIPIQMFEAWLLFDERAIRQAAGNPHGRVQLELPSLKRVESLPDPKNVLYELLKQASEAQGRRLKKLRPQERVHRLAELIDNYSPLRTLSAFQDLEVDIQTLIKNQGWDN